MDTLDDICWIISEVGAGLAQDFRCCEGPSCLQGDSLESAYAVFKFNLRVGKRIGDSRRGKPERLLEGFGIIRDPPQRNLLMLVINMDSAIHSRT